MSHETFSRYDSADYLKTEEDIAGYLDAVMREGGDDPPMCLARALDVAARVRARITGVTDDNTPLVRRSQ